MHGQDSGSVVRGSRRRVNVLDHHFDARRRTVAEHEWLFASRIRVRLPARHDLHMPLSHVSRFRGVRSSRSGKIGLLVIDSVSGPLQWIVRLNLPEAIVAEPSGPS